MAENNNNNINRRGFLKLLAGGTAAATFSMVGCAPKSGSGASRGGSTASDAEVPTDKMEYRTVPSTGDQVSLLGYGCMRWPMRAKADGTGEEIDQDAVNELVDYALAHGVNYFDTAPPYLRGLSEASMGVALSRHPRESYRIATKLSTQSNNPELRSREGSIAMYKRSKERLQVDYIDYYLIHTVGLCPDGGMKGIRERLFDNGMLDYLLEERKAGRIRHLGFSYHGDIKVYDYLLSMHDEVKWDFVQIQMNYVDWKYASGVNTRAEYLYGELTKRGIAVIIMEPLLGGRLASLPTNLAAMLKSRRPEESIASWAFRYVGSFPEVVTVLSGMTYMEHLQDNIRTYAPLDPLTDEEFGVLADVAAQMMEYKTVACTACQYCMPCPYGIDIPTVFSHYNKCLNDGNTPASSQSPGYREARRAFLVGYDRGVPKLRQASYCIGCDECVKHCPQSIKIPQELERIDKYVEQLKQELI